ncbi:MAG TPA: helix-turn-helix transcriptional regulator [Thermoanaerobaculia bacterium]|nr:helix-turn-helix transcriptional regulator [Thermoanaerobaculia bacterium]
MLEGGDSLKHASLFEELLERISIGICVYDQEGRLSWSNHEGRRLRALCDEPEFAISAAARVRLMDAGGHAIVMQSERIEGNDVVFLISASPRLDRRRCRAVFKLSRTECEVGALLIEGLTPGEIASRLGISISTTRTHLSRLFRKTSTRRQVTLAVRLLGTSGWLRSAGEGIAIST